MGKKTEFDKYKVIVTLKVVRDILGLNSEDNNESGDTTDNCSSVFESPSLIRGSALGNNYLRNDFLSLSRMKIDVCTKEIFHNNLY